MKNSILFRNVHGRTFLNDGIRGAVDRRTSVYTGQRQVFLTKNLLLSGTTAIHGGSELDIFVNSWTRVFCGIPLWMAGVLVSNDVSQKFYFCETRKAIYNMDVVN